MTDQAYWLAEPCAPWCELVHRDTDHLSDRFHCGQPRSVELRLENATVVLASNPDSELCPSSVELEIAQGYREAEPHIALWVKRNPEDTHRPELTPDEADRLGDALKELAKLARGAA